MSLDAQSHDSHLCHSNEQSGSNDVGVSSWLTQVQLQQSPHTASSCPCLFSTSAELGSMCLIATAHAGFAG